MQLGARGSILSVAVLSLAISISAQVTTGALTGTVTHDGQPLPAVTIAIASSAMQGTRTTYSYVNGDYNFAFLPPGDYTVTFAMEGMTSVTKTVTVGLARIERVSAAMARASVTESMTVVAAAPTVVETTDIQANYTVDLVEALPIGRTIKDVAAFAPGTVLGPAGRLIIAGSYNYDNLLLINGAPAADATSGQFDNLYIEDAVQETSVFVGSISAEYGRFTGGVVSSITKSGGNEFSGSFRDSFTNLAWTSASDFGEEDARSEVDETYEATLGGRVVRDRLWFFLAGRSAELNRRGFYTSTVTPLPTSVETDWRAEFKFTGQVSSSHSIVASWVDAEVEQTNFCAFGCWEDSTIDPARWIPRFMGTVRYHGVLRSNVLAEAGYSAREIRFEDSGGDHVTSDAGDPRDIALGTVAFDITQGGAWGSPVFCADCDTEIRESTHFDVKASYYLATADAGTHNIVAGYENFAESRISNNYQSGSNMFLYIYGLPPEREADGTLRPIVSEGDIIKYAPIPILSNGSDFTTESLFVNDKWDIGARWSVNLGVRYDWNDDVDGAGHLISKDSHVSPRLGLIYDLRGDGSVRVNASYSQYVSKVQEVFGAANGGGNPWYFSYEYRGPTVGGRGTGLGSFDVLEQVFRWFLDQGGTESSELLVYAIAAGANLRIEELDSPHVDEWTVGFGAQLGQRGFARVDYVNREWHDFYAQSTTAGDMVENPLVPGDYLDMITYFNTNDVERTYEAVVMQAEYRPRGQVRIGGNYTWSQSKGNEEWGDAEFSPFAYVEYRAYPQFNPVGRLISDQPHQARLWVSYDQPLGAFGDLNVSLLERYESGRPYSAVREIAVGRYVTNPGYATPPTRGMYYFSDRGEYRWEASTATDLALNYELPIREASIFVQGELLNVFNEQAQIGGNTALQILAPFDPFTETPIECPQGQSDCSGTHWQKRATFGNAIAPGHYQARRTYRFSAGVRF